MTGKTRQLVVKTLGQDLVLLGGQAVHWPSRATHDLFSVLLLSPRGATKFDLVEKLWGGTDVGETTGNFKVTLHRLRQALEDKFVVIEHGGRYSLSAEYLECSDCMQFQNALSLARAAATRDERVKRLSEAIAIYGGDYLPEQLHDWADETRIMLRAAYVQATLELARIHCGAVECHSAVRHLATGLASDPLVGENHHQTLMTCLCTLGRSDDAVSHYRLYRSYLEREIGDAPTGDTVRLADQIRNSEPHVSRQIGGPAGCPRRLLYGDQPPALTSWQPPDLAALARELGRGQLMLDLLTAAAEQPRGWAAVAGAAERLLTATLPGTHAALIRRTDLGQLSGLQQRLAPDWPGEVLRLVVVTLGDVKTSERGVQPVIQFIGQNQVVSQGVPGQRGSPDTWLVVTRKADGKVGASGFTSAEQEVLARMAQALSHPLSQITSFDPSL